MEIKTESNTPDWFYSLCLFFAQCLFKTILFLLRMQQLLNTSLKMLQPIHLSYLLLHKWETMKGLSVMLLSMEGHNLGRDYLFICFIKAVLVLPLSCALNLFFPGQVTSSFGSVLVK